MNIRIPPYLKFEDLDLHFCPSGEIGFSWSAIEDLCRWSNVDVSFFKYGDPKYVTKLVSMWYAVHLHNGGATDPILEELDAKGAECTLDSSYFQLSTFNMEKSLVSARH